MDTLPTALQDVQQGKNDDVDHLYKLRMQQYHATRIRNGSSTTESLVIFQRPSRTTLLPTKYDSPSLATARIGKEEELVVDSNSCPLWGKLESGTRFLNYESLNEIGLLNSIHLARENPP